MDQTSVPSPVAADHLDDADSTNEDEQELDTFPNDAAVPILDPESLRMVSRGTRLGGSVTTATAMASEIATDLGSVMGMPKEAFLKSFTVFRNSTTTDFSKNHTNKLPFDVHTDFELSDPVTTKGRFFNKKHHLHIESIGGIFGYSRIGTGDYLKSINGKAVAGSDREGAIRHIEYALVEDGYLSIITKSNTIFTNDILIHATVIKPRANMKFKEMGMVVWVWGYLCIKSIDKDSIFQHTALQETDHIISINDIQCDRVGVKGVAEILSRLTHDITITALRRKERPNGNFG